MQRGSVSGYIGTGAHLVHAAGSAAAAFDACNECFIIRKRHHECLVCSHCNPYWIDDMHRRTSMQHVSTLTHVSERTWYRAYRTYT